MALRRAKVKELFIASPLAWFLSKDRLKALTKTVFQFLIILNALTLNAQITIKSNDKSIRYDLIKPSHYFQKVTMYDSSGNVMTEFVNESLTVVDTIKQQILFSRTRQVPFGKQYADTSIINYLGPARYLMSSSPMTKRLEVKFNSVSVEIKAVVKGVKSHTTTKMDEGYFDDNIVEGIIGFIPFEKGVKYHLNSYRFESKGGQNPYDIQYVFDDIIQYPHRSPVNCSVLHVVNGYSDAYIWVDKITHANLKEVIQSKTSMIVVLTL